MKLTNTNRLAGLLSASALAISLVAIVQPAMAGISTTKHNLGSTGSAGNFVSDTAEICVFCHTPHGSNTVVAAPLWNKATTATAAANGYTMYTSANSATFDSNPTGAQPGNISLACLSCHDGTQAMDNIINAPGAGGYSSTGSGITGRAYIWTGNVRIDSGGQGRLANSGALIPMLDTDLRNDHPIGMNYCAGSNGVTIASTTTCADKDFNVGNGGLASARSWIDTSVGTVGTYEKTDLPLYKSGEAAPLSSTRVECATCHDPHSNNATFLRIVNTGSAVCLACHTK